MADDMAYCLRCKKKSKMHNIQNTTMKNGRPAQKATCQCGTKMFKILAGPSKSKSKSKSKKKGGKSRKKSKSKKTTKSKSRRKSKKSKKA